MRTVTLGVRSWWAREEAAASDEIAKVSGICVGSLTTVLRAP